MLPAWTRENAMSTILLVILILVLLGALPTWPYSRELGLLPLGHPRADRGDTDHHGGDGPHLGPAPTGEHADGRRHRTRGIRLGGRDWQLAGPAEDSFFAHADGHVAGMEALAAVAASRAAAGWHGAGCRRQYRPLRPGARAAAAARPHPGGRALAAHRGGAAPHPGAERAAATGSRSRPSRSVPRRARPPSMPPSIPPARI